MTSEAITPSPCRFCGTALHHTFCNLGMSPVSNAFIAADRAYEMERFYPLHAFVCESCRLVQLGEFQAPDEIFDDKYAYFSSVSESWLDHARRYVEHMIERFGFDADSQVVEIASNDGYLLQYFKQRGVPVLGIEPTANTAAAAAEKGIESWVRFFGTATAEVLRAEERQADLLLGNNVLAHVPDINDFVAGMKIALKPGGTITMEFPHLLQLMALNQFDTIYHEHFSYLSWLTVERIFASHGIRLFDVDELPTHGGSLRIYGCHDDDPRPTAERVGELRDREVAAGLAETDTYVAFQARVDATKRGLLKFLIDARERGQSVVGYGAPAKGNTLLNFCGVRTDLLDYTVDRSPHKQGMYLPGVHIPVLPPERIFETRPDYVLILPWNLRDEVMRQMADIRDWGGRFVVPIPEVQVLN